MSQGKKLYYIASTFSYGEYAQDARLFRQLSDLFEFCVYGLNLVRQEWERMGSPSHRTTTQPLLQS